MVIEVRDDAKLQDPRVGDLALDFFNLRRINIRNDDFNLVITSRSYNRFVHP